VTLDQALFNWLQIKYVLDQRPQDQAAKETYQFFSNILEEKFNIESVEVKTNQGFYIVEFEQNGESVKKQFPAQFVHQLWIDIETKYN
jgi:hypothetical protein